MVVVIVLCSTRKFYLLRKDPSSSVASVAELATILSPKRWNLRTHTAAAVLLAVN